MKNIFLILILFLFFRCDSKKPQNKIGVQFFLDVKYPELYENAFIKLRMPFTSDEAKALNQDIFETIYYASLTASKDLSKNLGPYETYKGSPISNGLLQFELWGKKTDDMSGRWDWNTLKKEIKKSHISH